MSNESTSTNCGLQSISLLSNDPNVCKKAALCSIRIVKKAPDLVENFVNPVVFLLKEKHHGVLLTAIQLCIDLCNLNEEDLEFFRKVHHIAKGSFIKKFNTFIPGFTFILAILCRMEAIDLSSTGKVQLYFSVIHKGNHHNSLQRPPNSIISFKITNPSEYSYATIKMGTWWHLSSNWLRLCCHVYDCIGICVSSILKITCADNTYQ
ncbi:hypothetical protein L2E82_47291 [Cichorium intybus]|uniref:Uncharacterized protein n=1 Tax=Cichorium intybus TaxID=13427 RepID=A0ACB8YVN9_CICIN|nr:hypothetical protein L2E82_47291 [Cichorium intybus]